MKRIRGIVSGIVCIVLLLSFAQVYIVSADTTSIASFKQAYAKVGEQLEVEIENPEAVTYNYVWKVNDTVVGGDSASYTPVADDLEKPISVTITGGANVLEAKIFCSVLPVVYINTEGNAPITSKEDYINADMRMQGNDDYTNSSELYNGKIEIRGRGNTTWNLPKKPYKIKLDKKADVLGMGVNKHWVLLAHYDERTGLRNIIASKFANDIGLKYSTESQNVTVVLNGDYQGTYQLSEQIRVDKERVDVFNWESFAEDTAGTISTKDGLTKDKSSELEAKLVENLEWLTSGQFTFDGKTYVVKDYGVEIPEVNGGFLIELDAYMDEVTKFFTSKLRQTIQISSPEFMQTNEKMLSYLTDYMNSFERMITSKDFTAIYNDKVTDYSELYDFDSLVKYWILNEFVVNHDSMKNSTYMYKDLNGKIYMGPAWDYDMALGNHDNLTGDENRTYNKWQTLYYSNTFENSGQDKQWYKQLIKDPYFIVKAMEEFKRVRPTIVEEYVKNNSFVDELILKEAPATKANIELWKLGDYTTGINKLQNFMKDKIKWWDEQFKDLDTFRRSLGVYQNFSNVKISSINTSVAGSSVANIAVRDKTAKYVTAHINNQFLGRITVKSGKAQVTIPDGYLSEDNSKNVLTVRICNDKGEYIMSSGTVIYDFVAFDKNKGTYVKPVVNINAPKKVTITPAGKNIKVQWSNVEKADMFKVYRSTDKKTYTKIGTSTTLNFVDRTTKVGKTYYYRIETANGKTGDKVCFNQTGSVKKLSAKKKKVTIKIKKAKYATGYRVYMAKPKGKYKAIRTLKKTTLKISVKKKGTYKFKVQPYRKISGKKVYGYQGKVKKVKVK